MRENYGNYIINSEHIGHDYYGEYVDLYLMLARNEIYLPQGMTLEEYTQNFTDAFQNGLPNPINMMDRTERSLHFLTHPDIKDGANCVTVVLFLAILFIYGDISDVNSVDLFYNKSTNPRHLPHMVAYVMMKNGMYALVDFKFPHNDKFQVPMVNIEYYMYDSHRYILSIKESGKEVSDIYTIDGNDEEASRLIVNSMMTAFVKDWVVVH